DIKPYSAGKVQYLKHQYVLEAEYLDEQLGILIETLKTRGLYDDTMIIISSDHGQAFNEHRFMYHGNYLYDEIVRVPLIVKYPDGRKFKKRTGYQSLVSIQAMIKSVIDGGDDSDLTTDFVFAEAFGNTENIPKSHQHRIDHIRKKYEKVRKSIYMNGHKLTVNGTDGRLEELIKGSVELHVHDKRSRSERSKLLKTMMRFNNDNNFIIPVEEKK
ncbi:MAG: sulfatase-like hydrolase/transferase, partial [Candidatus Micrarchaeota archaeon]|nr:sulfatase-like hydrolase/transferase [Candidatus Micrarchaeota archaeon]